MNFSLSEVTRKVITFYNRQAESNDKLFYYTGVPIKSFVDLRNFHLTLSENEKL
jgi:hypothetical protein